MVISNLYLCVGVTLCMVALGVWNIHTAMQKTKAAVKHEARGSVVEMMHFEEMSRGFENMGLALLFLCWLPCSNAAWITQASCHQKIQQMAATLDEPKSENIVGVAHGIALESSAGGVEVAYESKLPSGTEIAWSRVGDSRSATSITAIAGPTDDSRSALRLRLRNGASRPDSPGSGRSDHRTSERGGSVASVYRWATPGRDFADRIDEATAEEF